MKERILFIVPSRSQFTEIDRCILKARYDVLTIDLHQNKGRMGYLIRLGNLIWQTITNMRVKKVFIWFADYHAALAVLLCRLLGIKAVVFIGGFDSVCYPEFGYGVFYKRFRGICAAYALRKCDLIIANHQDLILSNNTFYQPAGHADGIRHFIPDLKTPTGVVYNGLETEKWMSGSTQRERTVLTVGGTPNLSDFFNKGYDLLIEAARKMPDLNFIFVGMTPKCLRHYDPIYGISRLSNVSVHHYIEHAELMEMYTKVQVYAQPSISEGMPNALMEAMLMGCVPVGSNVAGIPTLIGDTGFIIKHRCADELSRAIEQAMIVRDHDAISRRIRECFSIDKRRDGIFELLQRHLGSI